MTSSDEADGRAQAVLEHVFELASRLSDGMTNEFETQGLTTARAELLWRLHAAGPQTQRALSDALRCTPRNVTGLVNALEGSELVRREPHPTDGRAALVTLTDRGARTLEDWRSRYERFAVRLFGDIADEDLARFEAVLTHVLDRLRADLPLDAGQDVG